MNTIASLSPIEPLEARIAPAAVFVNANTATYNDNDGDHVTVHFTKPVLTAGNVGAVFTFNAAGYLAKLDLTASVAPDGTGIAFTVAKVAGGDGLANVGYINSTGHDLGAVTVKGDLGQIDAGDGTTATPGLKALSVRSLGRLGTDTQMGGGSLESDITGALGSLLVAGDVKDATVSVTGGADGKIGAVTIGGSLLGGAGSDSGQIFSSGDMGAVKIGHDLQGGSGVNSAIIETLGKIAGVSVGGALLGGAGTNSGQILSIGDLGAVKIGHDVQGGTGVNSGIIESIATLAGVSVGGALLGGGGTNSGQIFSGGALGAVKIGHDVQGGLGTNSAIIQAGGKLTGVSIGGSLLGSAGTNSGQIFSSGDLGAVKIGHDLTGGSGINSGFIETLGKLAGVTIGGSLLGGSNSGSGQIFSSGDMGAVKIGHDFTGGSITGTATLDSSGLIESSAGRIASVTIGGSIISGIDDSTNNQAGGDLTKNATIRAGNDLGSLTVAGSLIGHVTPNGASPVVISARGQATPLPAGATTDVAIGKISIGGRVEFANLLAGYNTGLSAVNGGAQIGAVKVGGDWAASNLVAGTKNLGADNAVGGSGANADNVNYGDSHDSPIGGSSIIAKIASITIAGQVFGTPLSVNMTDHFGFVAEQIGAVKIGGSAIVLAATNNPQPVGETADVDVHIIP